jgi:predicted nucleic acid-binding protein
MLVVSDTSPLNYLLLVEAIDLLPALFADVFVPPAVMDELSHDRTPTIVRAWAMNPPAWLHIQAPSFVGEISGLDRGETEAIALAEELKADAILVDERDACRVASQRGVEVIGTLAIRAKAVVRGLVDQHEIAGRLARTNFRAPPDLLADLVDRFRGSM